MSDAYRPVNNRTLADINKMNTDARVSEGTEQQSSEISGKKGLQHGDEVHYTGKLKFMAGAWAFEFQYDEGHRKGQSGWTYRKPGEFKLPTEFYK